MAIPILVEAVQSVEETPERRIAMGPRYPTADISLCAAIEAIAGRPVDEVSSKCPAGSLADCAFAPRGGLCPDARYARWK